MRSVHTTSQHSEPSGSRPIRQRQVSNVWCLVEKQQCSFPEGKISKADLMFHGHGAVLPHHARPARVGRITMPSIWAKQGVVGAQFSPIGSPRRMPAAGFLGCKFSRRHSDSGFASNETDTVDGRTLEESAEDGLSQARRISLLPAGLAERIERH